MTSSGMMRPRNTHWRFPTQYARLDSPFGGMLRYKALHAQRQRVKTQDVIKPAVPRPLGLDTQLTLSMVFVDPITAMIIWRSQATVAQPRACNAGKGDNSSRRPKLDRVNLTSTSQLLIILGTGRSSRKSLLVHGHPRGRPIYGT